MPQVAVKISESIFAKLKRLARHQGVPYSVIIESALSAYEPATSEHASHSASEIHGDLQALIESALRSVIDRVEALEQALATLTVEATPVYQPEPEVPEIASCAVTEPLPEPGIVDAAETADDDVGDMVESVEEGDLMEKEAVLTPPSILSKPIQQPLPSIEVAIKELGRQDYGQQAIANELNRRGYRTSTGTLIRRGWVGNKLKSLGL